MTLDSTSSLGGEIEALHAAVSKIAAILMTPHRGGLRCGCGCGECCQEYAFTAPESHDRKPPRARGAANSGAYVGT